ncbi:MAG: type II secretion system minor pseudopilin GspK [Candidatus Thiodiazotropha sp. (ex Lucinoma aequizonata)]|nr:type II secretion system minor pseudopilin GspK [Candidatus Thiodiazotropha sp. (ex Lucinoma aequizonata)]MCU7888423.1 type II secretion system minor pseudopilin GspK [Candidatus Thiodiazotropha sp. (ex Lucinoma aequizonata)]MCU7896304.1 type II secretion system minor pseudopilin GspK [Candidatus Thiodiazotropha sp. (ex Lucinoma aequizonata)]MCU7897280.1 type II secretion system minor pseudopilin GspK [Candidatus Thiodiazotropha sp. (ex Lucinoma aequizonata)]MCU7903950.1 type II secretion sy
MLKKRISHIDPERGVALITAIIVVSMASIATVSMTHDLQLSIRRTGNIINADQRYLYTLSSEAWSRGMLIRDLNDSKKKNHYDSLDEDWAQEPVARAVKGGQVQAITTDSQARFNLNNLYLEPKADEQAKLKFNAQFALFQRLLARLELPESIAQATADWLDDDINVLYPGGAEDLEYLSLELPYRTANGLMATPTELRLVKGVDEKIYEKLSPYITTLPERTTININTADKLLIQALSGTSDEASAEQLVNERKENPFKETKSFIDRLKALLDENKVKFDQITPLISVDSHYYQMETVVQMESSSQRLVSLLYKGKKDVVVISRTLGVY